MPQVATKTQPVARPIPPPPWIEKMARKFSAGVSHVFLITGNTTDFVVSKKNINMYLRERFGAQRDNSRAIFDIVAMFDRANGLTFSTKTMRTRFYEALAQAELAENSGDQNADTPQPSAQNADALNRAFAPNAAAGASAKPGLKAAEREPDVVFQMVEKVMTNERIVKVKQDDGEIEEVSLNMVFIINKAESIFPDRDWGNLQDKDRNCIVRVLNWAQDLRFQTLGNPVLLIATGVAKLHDQIMSSSSQIEQLEITLPNPQERAAFIATLEAQEEIRYENKFTAANFAGMTAGLSKVHIEDINLTAKILDSRVGPTLIKERKREILDQEYQKILEIIEPEYGFECIGGMQWVKDYMLENVIPAMLSGDVKRVPQGILLLGPGGTGKTKFAKALAKEGRMNMFNLNFGRLLGGTVGQSEQNMEKAILMGKSMEPCIGFVDEIGQAISRGSSGDSGVSNRLFKRFMEITADNFWRGKILWIAADNRPDQLDPALKRTGRFDLKIPFLSPGLEDRALIFPAVMRQYDMKTIDDINYKNLAKLTDKWVGSDIESAVIKGYQIAGRQDRNLIKEVDLVTAIKSKIVNSQETELWENLAIRYVNDIDLLPPHLRANFDMTAVETKIRTLREGSLDLELENSGRKAKERLM